MAMLFPDSFLPLVPRPLHFSVPVASSASPLLPSGTVVVEAEHELWFSEAFLTTESLLGLR